jgi:hypothetical protein
MASLVEVSEEFGGLDVPGGREQVSVVCPDFSGASIDEHGDDFFERRIVEQFVDRGVSVGFVQLSHGSPLRRGVG